ncbi:MAG: hypothetical protein ACI8WT_002569 [Clostridium sp.]
MDASKVNTNTLADYDTLIYGGGLYAVGINGVKLITKNLDKLKDKKVVVFATGEIKKELTHDDKGMLPSYDKPVDFTISLARA